MPDRVTVRDRDGRAFDVRPEEVGGYVSQGFTEEGGAQRAERIGSDVQHEIYGGPGGTVAAAGAGALSGITLGLSDVALDAAGGGHTLRALQEENPYTSLGANIVGAIAPAILSGGASAAESTVGLGAKILAHSPAALASRVGGAVTGLGKGAGLLARTAAGAAGAGAEGALYGGGQYLSQIALEDKPLSAEGFVGAMGHGALFAAPIGGAATLGQAALIRARSLFPRNEVTSAAASGIKQESTSGLAQAVSDGDTMAAAAERKLANVDAKLAQAQSGEQVTRRVFGASDPQAIADQAAGGVERTELAAALQEQQVAKARLADWVATEADPELEQALLGMQAPGVGVPGGELGNAEAAAQFRSRGGGLGDPSMEGALRELVARPDPVGPGGVAVGEFGAPGARAFKSQEEMARLAAGTDAPGMAPSLDPPPVGDSTRVLRGGAKGTPVDLQAAPAADVARRGASGDATSAFKLEDGNLRFDPKKRSYFDPSGAAMEPTPVGEMRLGLPPRLEPAEQSTTVRAARGSTPEPFSAKGYADAVRGQDFTSAGSAARKLGGEAPVAGDVPAYQAIKAHEAKADDYLEQTLPARTIADRGYYEPPGGGIDAVRVANARKAISDGQREAVKLNVTPTGKITVTDGRHRLAAAIDADAPIKVKWSTGSEPAADDVARAGVNDLLAQLQGTAAKLGEGAELKAIGAPARAEYAAGKAVRTTEAAEHFRAQAIAKNYEGSAMGAEERAAQAAARPSGGPGDLMSLFGLEGVERAPASGAAETGALKGVLEEHGIGAGASATSVDHGMGARIAEHENLGKTIVDRAMRERMGGVVEREQIERALAKHNGKNVDIGPDIGRAAKAIGDVEAANARLADALGADAPYTAVENAKRYHAAMRAQADASASSSAKAAADIKSKLQPAQDATVVDDQIAKALRIHDAKQVARGLTPEAHAQIAALKKESARPGIELSERKAIEAQIAELESGRPPPAAPGAGTVGGAGDPADLGTSLAVLRALGVHRPAISAIPIIGPILGLFLKARAVMGILGRKGGSIGRSTEGLIASKAAATQERIVAATGRILEGAARGAGKVSAFAAGPAVLLAGKLFPGGDDPKGNDPRALFAARMDEIARAQAPGAIDRSISERYHTSDPELHDALVAQIQRGIQFLDGKAPKQTVLPGMLPGDGKWQPSRSALEVFGKYVKAVNDPASVLEDLANGHVSMEGAETLRVVYPKLFAYAQQMLLEAAPKMQATLPYARRVSISIMYQVPVDVTMQPSHMQFLRPPPPSGSDPTGSGQGGAPMAPPPPAPAMTGPLKTGAQTMTPLDRRAGA